MRISRQAEPQASSEMSRLETLESAAAGVAHDINNELTLMLNYLSVSGDGTPYREILLEATERCSSLTRNLLSCCRGEAILCAPVNIAEFLRQFAASVYVPPTVHLSIEISDSSQNTMAGTIQANRDALRRVLTNLIMNACQAMNDSGDIVLSAVGSTISVRDSGLGIEPAHSGRIFEPFFTTKTEQGRLGTGLGLAIVKDLMAKQGGSVSLVSEPGRGACFELRFKSAD